MCGKEGRGDVIKDHIEANHLEGMEFPCDICGKTSRTRNALNVHKHTLCKYKSRKRKVFLIKKDIDRCIFPQYMPKKSRRTKGIFFTSDNMQDY